MNADKPLAVTVQAEGGQVQVSEKADKDALCCDINTFTQLFAGGLTVAQAAGYGAFGWRQSRRRRQPAMRCCTGAYRTALMLRQGRARRITRGRRKSWF